MHDQDEDDADYFENNAHWNLNRFVLDVDVVSQLLEKVYATWEIENDVSCNAVENLLKRTVEFIPGLKSPVRYPTLMGTPTEKLNIKTISNGQYYYFGLRDCLTKINTSRERSGFFSNQIELQLETEGADLGNSSDQNK